MDSLIAPSEGELSQLYEILADLAEKDECEDECEIGIDHMLVAVAARTGQKG